MILVKFQISLIILCRLSLADEDQCNTTCPTWTVCDGTFHHCVCGTSIRNTVTCSISGNSSEVGILFGFCMTLNKANSSIVVGSCPFNVLISSEFISYLNVPSNRTNIDSAVCGGTDRTGQLCGQCMNGHSPPVYSYYPQCVRCRKGTNNWPKYSAVSLLPATVLFLVVTVLRFRATSDHMNGYILFSQVFTSPPIMRQFGGSLLKHHYVNKPQGYVTQAIIAYFGIWNLDFFRLLYTPFCLHPNATTLQVLSLDYIIAVYPLLLITLTYTLVRLHYNNCRLVVWMWRPFIGCFARCRRQWDIQNSLLDAFATFFLLSYVRFLHVSCDILTLAHVWDVLGRPQHPVLYYDGTVEYFSRDHVPFAIIAIIVLVLFVIFPILVLCVYPCRCFQKFLNRYNMSSPALHCLMDTFQGHYKDGTAGTRDYRSFSASCLLLRASINTILEFTIFSFNRSIAVPLMVAYILFLFAFQPHKVKSKSVLEAYFIGCIVALLSLHWNLYEYDAKIVIVTSQIMIYFILLVALLYPLCVVSYHIHRKSQQLQAVTKKIKLFFTRRSSTYQELLYDPTL